MDYRSHREQTAVGYEHAQTRARFIPIASLPTAGPIPTRKGPPRRGGSSAP